MYSQKLIGAFSRLCGALLVAAASVAFVAAPETAFSQEDGATFAMVTHGAPGEPFWERVQEGAKLAAEDFGVTLVSSAPDEFDIEEMVKLAEDALATDPDGLILSIPNPDALAPVVTAAKSAGVPVITINSGFDVGKSLGAELHVGQGEYEAGRILGETMRALNGTTALCVNHEVGNVGLDLRCLGFIDSFGGSVEVVAVDSDFEAVKTEIAARLTSNATIDVILALNAGISGQAAIDAVDELDRDGAVRIAAFDVTPDILQAVADGKATIAVDQQPFLQGYLPVQFLALQRRHGVLPVDNIATGPRLVFRADAQKLLDAPADEGASD